VNRMEGGRGEWGGRREYSRLHLNRLLLCDVFYPLRSIHRIQSLEPKLSTPTGQGLNNPSTISTSDKKPDMLVADLVT